MIHTNINANFDIIKQLMIHLRLSFSKHLTPEQKNYHFEKYQELKSQIK